MSTDRQPDDPLVDLPHLAEIFEALRRGRHLDIDDGVLYGSLKAKEDAYTAMFAQLGFELRHHARDFFHFLDRANFTDLSARMAVFMLVLIEHLADRGDPIAETLMTRRFRYEELPHLVGDRSRQLMAEAGTTTPDDLEQIVSRMERYGFTRREDGESFVFRAPAYRFLDLCLEMAAAPEPDAGSEGVESGSAP